CALCVVAISLSYAGDGVLTVCGLLFSMSHGVCRFDSCVGARVVAISYGP
ncbi:Multidrug Resistance-Associated Protein 4, partial [Manis pentadactyla]